MIVKVLLANGLAAHLLRGVVGFPLLVWAIAHAGGDPVFALAAGVAAVVALRGCPTCWLLGFCFVNYRNQTHD